MDLYSERAEERRRQFNKIIDGCGLVLCNEIVNVDISVLENWEGKSPFDTECDIVDNPDEDVDTDFWCEVHELHTNELDYCEEYSDTEVFQWFLCNASDAEFLKRHGQYITYSNKLDVYVLAITHFGTGWDYTSMVDAFEDCYVGLEKFSGKEKRYE